MGLEHLYSADPSFGSHTPIGSIYISGKAHTEHHIRVKNYSTITHQYMSNCLQALYWGMYYIWVKGVFQAWLWLCTNWRRDPHKWQQEKNHFPFKFQPKPETGSDSHSTDNMLKLKLFFTEAQGLKRVHFTNGALFLKQHSLFVFRTLWQTKLEPSPGTVSMLMS